VFKKPNFTIVLRSSEPKNSDFVSSTSKKLQDVIRSDFNLAIWEIPLIYEIKIVAYYTIYHDSYNSVRFAVCGRHESR